jgi:hypothetical protein
MSSFLGLALLFKGGGLAISAKTVCQIKLGREGGWERAAIGAVIVGTIDGFRFILARQSD